MWLRTVALLALIGCTAQREVEDNEGKACFELERLLFVAFLHLWFIP
jgi:hypothetical protein